MKFKYAIVRYLPNLGVPDQFIPFGVVVSDYDGRVAAVACLEQVPLPHAHGSVGPTEDRPQAHAAPNGSSLKNPGVSIASFLRQSRRRNKKIVHALDHLHSTHHFSVGILEPVGFAEACDDVVKAARDLFLKEVVTHRAFPPEAKSECVSELV